MSEKSAAVLQKAACQASLRDFISQKIPLSHQAWQLIEAVTEYKFIAQEQFLLQQGKVCMHLYFLNEGLLRYFIWKEGEDRVVTELPAESLGLNLVNHKS